MPVPVRRPRECLHRRAAITGQFQRVERLEQLTVAVGEHGVVQRRIRIDLLMIGSQGAPYDLGAARFFGGVRMNRDQHSFEYEDVDFVSGQPYAQWARARDACPVIQTDGGIVGVGERPLFQITRRDDVERVLRDPQTFSSSINGEHMGPYMGELILAMDGQEHRTYRNLVAHAFRASQLQRWEESLIRPSIEMCIADIAPLGRADLVRGITKRFPARVICAVVGVPVEDSAQFQDWSEQINGGPMHPKEGMAASRGMRDYLEP